MELPIDISLVLSGASTLITSYFWFVRANKERPCLEFVQLSNFLMSSRRNPDRDGYRRVFFQQRGTGGVLIVNHSSRQNSILKFNCFLKTDEGEIAGDWGYGGEDKPPWNIGPETTIAFSPACFFDVPEDLELPENPHFRIEFITASKRRFKHAFRKQLDEETPSQENAVGRAA